MPHMQLDIFADSREVMLRNGVLDALQRREAAAARVAWDALHREFADDETAITLAVLIKALAPAECARLTLRPCARLAST